MKKVMLVILMTGLLSWPAFLQQKEIIEEVSVDWWVVPVFAVSPTGEPVLDLTETDIELRVDNRPVPRFTLVKKNFTVQEQAPDQGKETAPLPAREREKNVFLLFDTALSTQGCTDAAKLLAKKIISEAEPGTQFFIMTIEPFAGLVYAGGKTADRSRLLEIIDKKVKGKTNSRIPDPAEVVAEVDGKFGSKYDSGDLAFINASLSKYYKRKSKNFVQSFESLYYALNAIKDNKFVYLFTEGISDALQELDKGDVSMYREYLRQAAGYLGRSGSVLFIIDPVTGAGADLSRASGKNSLLFLAQNSGGKYLAGNDRELTAKIENFHRAYYEIFFPAVPKSQEGVLKISLLSKRSGIELHSLQAAEKTRDYSRMKTIEQEVLALNLISGNPLADPGVIVETAEIKKISKKKDKVIYRVVIPGQSMNRTLDLYKAWAPAKNIEEAGFRVEKESLRTGKEQTDIVFKSIKPGDTTYFALIDGERKIALVHGVKKEQGETFAFSLPQEEEWATPGVMAQEQGEEAFPDTGELEKLLDGVAEYCEKLKNAAFHYTCKEKIAETQTPLGRDQRQALPVDDDSSPTTVDIGADLGHPNITAPMGWQRRETILTEKVYAHAFNYRLIKKTAEVKEERDMIIQEAADTVDKKEMEKPVEKTAAPAPQTTKEALKGFRFVSGKAVFGPVTLLAADRQPHYSFRLLGHQELDGRRTAILEAFPKSEKDSMFIYGKIWIDTEDFSVLKIKANPNSIQGYERLRKFADSLSTRLLLTMETDFYKLVEGLRFPTQIRFEEFYKGGAFLTARVGSKGWKRTDSLTTYSDYLFFNVDMDVTYEK